MARRSGRVSLDTATLDYLVANQGSATWLVAVSDATSAGQVELATGRAVMAMGGFTGSDNALTLAQLQALVASGELRFVAVGGGGGGRARRAASSSVSSLGHLGLHGRQRRRVDDLRLRLRRGRRRLASERPAPPLAGRARRAG